MKLKDEKGPSRFIYLYCSESGSYRTADRALKATIVLRAVSLTRDGCQISHAFIGPVGEVSEGKDRAHIPAKRQNKLLCDHECDLWVER
jgi:hypothetical protein